MIVSKEVLQRKNRVSCVGDMRERVKLHIRAMQEPNFDETNFTESFTGVKIVWANVRTVSGKTFFTSVNVDVSLTHEIVIRYDEDVNAETWIEYNGRNLKIVDTEDLDERHEFLKLKCTDRGDPAFRASISLAKQLVLKQITKIHKCLEH